MSGGVLLDYTHRGVVDVGSVGAKRGTQMCALALAPQCLNLVRKGSGSTKDSDNFGLSQYMIGPLAIVTYALLRLMEIAITIALFLRNQFDLFCKAVVATSKAQKDNFEHVAENQKLGTYIESFIGLGGVGVSLGGAFFLQRVSSKPIQEAEQHYQGVKNCQQALQDARPGDMRIGNVDPSAGDATATELTRMGEEEAAVGGPQRQENLERCRQQTQQQNEDDHLARVEEINANKRFVDRETGQAIDPRKEGMTETFDKMSRQERERTAKTLDNREVEAMDKLNQAKSTHANEMSSRLAMTSAASQAFNLAGAAGAAGPRKEAVEAQGDEALAGTSVQLSQSGLGSSLEQSDRDAATAFKTVEMEREISQTAVIPA